MKIPDSFEAIFNSVKEAENVSAKEIIEVLAGLQESVADSKVHVPKWRFLSQTMVSKITYNSHSILHISQGFEFGLYQRNDKIHIVDSSSIFILTRALIENYLTLCYIYNNNLDEEEQIFRYKLWEVSGLISRQNFESNSEPEIIKLKESEKVLVDNILQEIKNMPEYSHLNGRKLNALKLHGLPRVISWHNLITECGLNKKLFFNLYSLSSIYAHTEYLSVLQLSQLSLNKKNEFNNANINLCIKVIKMLVANSILFYTKTYTSAEITFKTYPTALQNSIQLWSQLSKG